MANPGDVKGKAQETAGKVADQAKETAGSLVDKTKEAASNLADRARGAASTVGHTAEDLTERAGGALRSAGESVREYGPGSGYLGSATEAVASTLESGGRYLEREGLGGMADDLTTLIRRNPIPALLVGIGLGFLLSRLTRS